MGRWDHDDPADEHDIRELRRAMQDGTPAQLIGGGGQVRRGKCLFVAVALVGSPIVAAIAAAKGIG